MLLVVNFHLSKKKRGPLISIMITFKKERKIKGRKCMRVYSIALGKSNLIISSAKSYLLLKSCRHMRDRSSVTFKALTG
jgi:hypothetical protein